jgi:ABC-type lipoprotein export system ATPase subunit
MIRTMLIDANALEKSYRDRQGTRVPVLKALSLQVAPGEFVAIQGASGSGKSTLLNILGCLDRPDSGTYRFDGEDVGLWPEQRRAALRNRSIGFVFQAFHLLPFLTVAQNIDLPFSYNRDGRRPPPGHVADLLKLVGLEDLASRYPGELSGGQQQRVAIARALVLGAGLILADEPTGNLDAATARGIIDLFDRLIDQGKTVLLVTHDPAIAARARRQVAMEDGRITSDERRGLA